MEEVVFSILFDIRSLFPGSVLLMNQHFMEVFVSVAYFVRLWSKNLELCYGSYNFFLF